MGYSTDLRLRAVSYFLEHKQQYREVADLFQIGVATLHDWVRRFRKNGSIECKKSSGRPRLVGPEENDAFKDFINVNRDKSLRELADGWHINNGKQMSDVSCWRSIRRLGLSYKKTFRACERDNPTYTEKLNNFLYELALIPKEHRVYLDEAGSHLGMVPLRAWSPRNERAYDKRPAKRGGNISMVGALKTTGMEVLYPYDGAVNAERFLHFIEHQLHPKLSKHDVLIMDNCRTHHALLVKKRLKELGIGVLFMPPYSPELNPIEEAWSIIKEKLRRRKPRNISEYVKAIIELKNCITNQISEALFRHAASFGTL